MRKRGFIREPVKRAALILLAAIMITAGTGCAATSQKGGSTVSEQEENKKDEQAVSAGEGSSMKNGVEYAAEEGGTAAGAAQTTAREKENAGGEKKAEKTPETDLLQEIPENPVQNDDGSVTMDVFAMDTYMHLLAYGADPGDPKQAEKAVRAAAKEIHSLDSRLSTGLADSEVSRLNAAGGGALSGIVRELILRSQDLRKETGGLFEIAIYPVMKLWGFPTQEFRVPEKEEIDAALKLADASAISVTTKTVTETVPLTPEEAAQAKAAAAGKTGTETGKDEAGQNAENTENSSTSATAAVPAVKTVTKKVTEAKYGIKGMEIDLGGIAKGYTGDRVMQVFKKAGIYSGLISLGGNVQALGSKPDGSPWRVAIQDPQNELEYLGVLEISDKAVITSGGYERFFEEDGVRYHHIIDPRTGYPADSGLISATIISEDGTLADGLSTSLFIMGKDEAEEFWRANSDKFDYILESADGRLYVTEGVVGSFTTNAKTIVIRKKK